MQATQYPSALGAFIRVKREQKKLTMSELARTVGLKNVSQISKLERGIQRSAHKKTLEKLAKALDTDAELLYVLSQQLTAEPPEGFPTLDEVLAAAGFEPGTSVEAAVMADDTIKRKEWVLECIEMARQG